MPNNHSIEFKNLISNAREMAIALGYDFISSLHFFLADCESKAPQSIYQFCFETEEEFHIFKRKCTLENAATLEYIHESLPLTVEAVKCIENAKLEQIHCQQMSLLPHHFFLAAFKMPDSILATFFKEEPDILLKLKKYYLQKRLFEKAFVPTFEKKVETKPSPRQPQSILDYIKKFIRK